MADLDPLIRYRKHIVDEKQRFLAQLYRDAENLEKQKQILLERMEKERQLAEDMATADAQAYLGRYLEGVRKKVKALDQSLRKMETRIAAAQEDMRAAFAEQKKVEITQRNREERAAAAQKRKEDNALDEIAIEGFRRQEDKI